MLITRGFSSRLINDGTDILLSTEKAVLQEMLFYAATDFRVAFGRRLVWN